MCKGSSPFVIQVLGVFQGKLPSSGPSTHLGLVMEFMERGSLASLQVHEKHIQKMYHSFNGIEWDTFILLHLKNDKFFKQMKENKRVKSCLQK